MLHRHAGSEHQTPVQGGAWLAKRRRSLGSQLHCRAGGIACQLMCPSLRHGMCARSNCTCTTTCRLRKCCVWTAAAAHLRLGCRPRRAADVPNAWRHLLQSRHCRLPQASCGRALLPDRCGLLQRDLSRPPVRNVTAIHIPNAPVKALRCHATCRSGHCCHAFVMCRQGHVQQCCSPGVLTTKLAMASQHPAPTCASL